jgi:hypothetical protein
VSFAFQLYLASKRSRGSSAPPLPLAPRLGDFVSFFHPEFRREWHGFIIMVITEPGKPTRCEIIVRHGNTGYPTLHWLRTDQLTTIAHTKLEENRHHMRCSVRLSEQYDPDAGETS